MEPGPCLWRTVPVEHLKAMAEEIGSKLKDGLLDKALFEDYLAHFTPRLPDEATSARSIVIAAVPQPAARLIFQFRGQAVPITLPPTYMDADLVDRHVAEELRRAYGPERIFVKAYVPLKYAAVRSGLALYGRNNIAYTPEYGSFFRLTAFFSDITPEKDHWDEPHMMPECEDCSLCVKACPAKVMAGGRFLARAERCLTYLNEKPSMVAFPEWVKDFWHNSIIGCMICQRVCPANRRMVGRIEDRGEFSEEETAYLLAGNFSRGSETMERKLENLGIPLSVFPRNLRAILGGRQPPQE